MSTALAALLLGPLAVLLGSCSDSGEAPPPDSGSEGWSVYAIDAGERPIEAIKAVRQVTGLGLFDARNLVDGVPSVICEGLLQEEARDVATLLQDAGMTVEVRRP